MHFAACVTQPDIALHTIHIKQHLNMVSIDMAADWLCYCAAKQEVATEMQLVMMAADVRAMRLCNRRNSIKQMINQFTSVRIKMSPVKLLVSRDQSRLFICPRRQWDNAFTQTTNFCTQIRKCGCFHGQKKCTTVNRTAGPRRTCLLRVKWIKTAWDLVVVRRHQPPSHKHQWSMTLWWRQTANGKFAGRNCTAPHSYILNQMADRPAEIAPSRIVV